MKAARGEATAWLKAIALAEDDGLCKDWPFDYAGNRPKLRRGAEHRQCAQIILELTGRPKPSPKHEARHSCDRGVCLAPWHLSWSTHAENMSDMSKRERSRTTKLTAEDVRQIRQLYSGGFASTYELADTYQVSRFNISCIINYKTWRHTT